MMNKLTLINQTQRLFNQILEHSHRLGLLCVLMLAGGSMPLHAEGCVERYKDQFSAAIGNTDFARLTQLFESSDLHATCSAEWVKKVRYKAIGATAGYASRMLKNGDTDGAEKLIGGKGRAKFIKQSHWLINAVHGDIARKRRNWHEAALQYGEAYENAALVEVPEGVQEKLYNLSNEAMRLHGGLDVVIGRGGEFRGVFGSRGPKPVSVPVPVQFDFNSAELTPQIKQNAVVIAQYLKKKKHRSIALTGHTDQEGCASYNQGLSERRANTLAKAVHNEYRKLSAGKLDIQTRGLGELCPPVISDGDYSDDDFRALSRRVELRVGKHRDQTEELCDVKVLQPDSCVQ